MENENITPNYTVPPEPVPAPEAKPPKKNLALIVIGIVLGLLILGGTAYWYFNQQNQPVTTGAVIETLPPDTKKAYDELYALLDKGDIKGDGFEIIPSTQNRSVTIIIKSPVVENTQKAKDWLSANGFGDIPQEKITFQEAQ